MMMMEKMRKRDFKVGEYKLYGEEHWRPYGFIGLVAVKEDGDVVAVSQDTYSAQCADSLKEAERFVIAKINKMYDI
jgi:hypothetical protein